jgi:hypothetical protein
MADSPESFTDWDRFPKLYVRQRTGEAIGGGYIAPGNFYLGRRNPPLFMVFGKEVEVEIISFRERVVVFDLLGNGEKFSSVDPSDPRFVEVKTESMKLKRSFYQNADGEECGWELEAMVLFCDGRVRVSIPRNYWKKLLRSSMIGAKLVYKVETIQSGFYKRLASVNGIDAEIFFPSGNLFSLK